MPIIHPKHHPSFYIFRLPVCRIRSADTAPSANFSARISAVCAETGMRRYNVPLGHYIIYKTAAAIKQES